MHAKTIIVKFVKHPTALAVSFLILLTACGPGPAGMESIKPVNWRERTATLPEDWLLTGTTYLSVYSEIYSETEHLTHQLTVTVSLRNTDRADTVYLRNAEYYDSSGASIRSYFNQPVYLAPMETVEIVIAEDDIHGGTGGNFLFDWSIRPGGSQPLFEAVMISTYGAQGLSFATKGELINLSQESQ